MAPRLTEQMLRRGSAWLNPSVDYACCKLRQAMLEINKYVYDGGSDGDGDGGGQNVWPDTPLIFSFLLRAKMLDFAYIFKTSKL